MIYLRIFATHDNDRLSSVRIDTPHPWLVSKDEADAIAAIFPKTYGFRVGSAYVDGEQKYWRVSADINLRGQRKHGGISGSGVDRYHKIIKKAEAVGISLEWEAPFANAYRSREVFEAALPW